MVTETNKFSYLLSSHPIANTFFKHFNYPCCSVTQSHSTLCDPWTSAHQASLSFTISQNLLKLMSFESVMPSNHLILCRPLLFLPSIVPSMRVFSNESALHMAKVLEFQHQSFQWILRVDFFYDGLVWSPCCPRDSQESSLAPVWKLPGWVKKVKVKSLSHVGLFATPWTVAY